MEVSEKPATLANGRYLSKDFSGMDLRGVPMHNSKFTLCNFKKANISGNDCSHSDFSGSNLTETNCNGTNFAHAKLSCRFYPSDAYGITVTLECKTFRGMMVSKLWWYAWVYFAMLMVPEKDQGKTLPDLVIKAIGSDRYLKLKTIFDRRQM